MEYDIDDSGAARFALGGELDVVTIEPLRAAVDSAIDADVMRIVFDLAAVEFVDSAALSLFSQTALRVSVVIEKPSDLVRRVIQVTGLDSILQVGP